MGVFPKHSKWVNFADKLDLPVVKVQLKFCKYLLNVHYNATNNAWSASYIHLNSFTDG